MYLFVFVFLVMSVVGLYTQVYALQMSKMYEKQTGAAQIMLTWHEGMKKHVKDKPGITDAGYTKVQGGQGCYLTKYVDWPELDKEIPNGRLCDSYVVKEDSSYDNDDTKKILPGYNFKSYKFRSMVYKPANASCSTCAFSNQVILITYIKAGQTVAGFNAKQVAQQLQNIGVNSAYIGFVNSAGQVRTNDGVLFAIPSVGSTLQEGSLVLLSQVTGPIVE